MLFPTGIEDTLHFKPVPKHECKNRPADVITNIYTPIMSWVGQS